MAKIGMLYPRYCKITETEGENGAVVETLGPGKVFGKAIKATVTITTNDTKLYADDGVAESVKEFISGLMSFETDDIDDPVLSDIHGAAIDTAGTGGGDGEITQTTMDKSPPVRFGFIVRQVRKGVVSFRVVVYMKTQFALPNDDYETKGESIVYKTTTETADIMRNSAFVWKKQQSFAELENALTYLNSMTNMGV